MSDQSEQRLPDLSGLLIALAVAPVYWILKSLGYQDVGRTAGISLGVILIAVRLRWYLRKHFWFWAIVAVMLLAHIPLILGVRWPDYSIPGIALLPIGVLDLLIVLGVIRLAESLLDKPTS